MKKIIAAVLFLFISINLSGCFQQASAPMKVLNEFIDDMKSVNVQKLSSHIDKVDNILPKENQDDWLKIMSKNLIYELVSENIEDTSANIKLKMSNTNVDYLMQNIIINISNEAAKNGDKLTEDDIKKEALSKAKSEVSSFEQKISKEIELKFEKKNNNWIILTNNDFEYIVTGNADIK